MRLTLLFSSQSLLFCSLYLNDNDFPATDVGRETHEYDDRLLEVEEIWEDLERLGCLVPLEWRPSAERHRFVSFQTHAEIRTWMLVSKRISIPRDVAYLFCGFISTRNAAPPI